MKLLLRSKSSLLSLAITITKKLFSSRIRGRIVSLQQCFINLGILSAFWIQYGASFLDGNASWRLALGLQMIPTVSLHLTMYFMPESPRWLAKRDEHEKALKALAKLHSNGDINDPFVQAELVEIEAKIQWERENPPPSYLEMLIGRDRRRTWLGIGVVRPNSYRRFKALALTHCSNSGNKLRVLMCMFTLYERVCDR